MIPPITPEPKVTKTNSTICGGIMNKTTADQTERQGTQLNGLKLRPKDLSKLVILKNTAKKTDAIIIIFLNRMRVP